MMASSDPSLANPPPGFHSIRHSGNFNSLAGPFFYRADKSSFVTGFRIMEHHLNPANVMHGGMSVVFADMTLGLGMSVKCGISIFMPTVNLTTDFLAGGRAGAWVEGDARLIRRTRGMVFAETLLTADGEPFLRCSGVMKIPSANSMSFDRDLLFPELKTAGYVPEHGG
jgi:acyl-coenzyme A thioesterase PaaI-like protein